MDCLELPGQHPSLLPDCHWGKFNLSHLGQIKSLPSAQFFRLLEVTYTRIP